MHDIKSIVAGICISLLLIGFFLKLSPDGAISKGYRYILSLVVLLIVISPLYGGYEINWDSFDNNASAIKYTHLDYENRIVNNVISLLKKDVEDCLRSHKVGFYSVKVLAVETYEGTEIKKIKVNIKSGFSPVEVEKMISGKFDLPCEAAIGGD